MKYEQAQNHLYLQRLKLVPKTHDLYLFGCPHDLLPLADLQSHVDVLLQVKFDPPIFELFSVLSAKHLLIGFLFSDLTNHFLLLFSPLQLFLLNLLGLLKHTLIDFSPDCFQLLLMLIFGLIKFVPFFNQRLPLVFNQFHLRFKLH
jgi:hypothetical protein